MGRITNRKNRRSEGSHSASKTIGDVVKETTFPLSIVKNPCVPLCILVSLGHRLVYLYNGVCMDIKRVRITTLTQPEASLKEVSSSA